MYTVTKALWFIVHVYSDKSFMFIVNAQAVFRAGCSICERFSPIS